MRLHGMVSSLGSIALPEVKYIILTQLFSSDTESKIFAVQTLCRVSKWVRLFYGIPTEHAVVRLNLCAPRDVISY